MTAMPCAMTSSIKILSKFHYKNVWKIDHSFRFQFAGKVRYPLSGNLMLGFKVNKTSDKDVTTARTLLTKSRLFQSNS